MSTVWIVDDSATEIEMARRALGGAFELTCFTEGTALLERLNREQPEVLVLDWHLPGMTGIEICKFLRAQPKTSHLPILILSGMHSSSHDIVEGLQAGANDYVIKPYSPIELVARVGALVRGRKLRERAERAETTLSDVLRHLPDPFLAADLAGRVTFANALAERLFSVDALVGRRIAEVVPAFARLDLSTSVAGQLADVAVGGRIFSPALNRLTMSDGSEAVTVTFRDVTERVQAVEQRDRFMAMLGHELRNPLAPIVSATELLRLKPGDVDTAQRVASIVGRQALRLTRLVDDLLDIARLSRGRIEIHVEPVNVARAVQRAIETLQPFLEARRHRLTIRVPESLWVNADVIRFDQIVTNLLHNGAKYTEPQGVLEIEGSADGKDVVLHVRDTGIGIRPEMLGAIFEMFVQVDDSLHRPQGGLGIGLALVKQLVEIHGGTIGVASGGVGKGSEFTLRLPAASSVAAATNAGLRGRPSGHLRVLVVDDNEDAVELLAEAIGFAGHEVRVAKEGRAALEVAESFAPQVVLLDIGLPTIDGYEVARQLRGTLGLHRTLLVALTGYGQKDDVDRALRAGFDRHLVKPVSIETVDELLAGVVRS